VLKDITFSFELGKVYAILGSSGSGKTTLLSLLGGLDIPTTGTILYENEDIKKIGLESHRQNHVSLIFQNYNLIATRGSLASLWPWSKADKLEALAAIDRVGLLEKALARADTLSGGQQQRIGIARALVQKPRLLLADEPVASLDPATAQSVLTLLHDICKKDRLTAIVSLHQVNLARMFADRIVGLRQGQVVFDGTAAQLTEEAQSALYAKSSPANMGSQFDSPSQSKEFLPC